MSHYPLPVQPLWIVAILHDNSYDSPLSKAMRVVKCFSLEDMALEMLSHARDVELDAQWYKRKVQSLARDQLVSWAGESVDDW